MFVCVWWGHWVSGGEQRWRGKGKKGWKNEIFIILFVVSYFQAFIYNLTELKNYVTGL